MKGRLIIMLIENQKDFFTELSARTGKDKKECVEFYNKMVEMIIDSANSSDETSTNIPMIGKLHVKVRPMHIALNPRNNEKVLVNSSRRSNLHLFPRFIRKLS